MEKYDLVLLEKEGDSGLTGKEVAVMTSLLTKDEFYPVEYYNRGGESCAMGFITRDAADRLDFEYDNQSELGDCIGEILADMNLESEDGTYEFEDEYEGGIRIFLTRNLPVLRNDGLKLGDLLALIKDESTVIVTEDYSEIARYDGRDSIPTELNSRRVLDIWIKEVLESNADPAIAIEVEECTTAGAAGRKE